MKWIDSTNLRNWAQRRDCQEHLPLLVRKLIRATSNTIKSISFPAGENVLIGGWDGILEVAEETNYLPKDISLWEFGTNADIKGKAESEYNKRTPSPRGFEPKAATFIFVTPRLWTTKQDWVKEKQAQGVWKDVRVYDAQDLEEWIDTAPPVGAWLAVKHLGLTPAEGVHPADEFWEEWSSGKKIKFVPDVVLAGRDHQSEILLEKTTEPNIVAVQANSKEEALAFVVATFLKDPDRSEDFFSRCLIVDRIEAFRELSVMDKPYYLLCRFDDDSALNKAKQKGHTIIVPLGLDRTDNWSDKITLPPLPRDTFVKAMMASGLTEEQAEDISKKSARNLIVVRRQLEFKRLNPEWAVPKNVRAIIPSMLAGRWNGDDEGDRQVIAGLAGEEYEAYIRKLQPWLFSPDAPIVKIGNTWRLTSPMDAWTHAARYCTRDDFDRLAALASEVLSSVDNKFEKSADERRSSLWYTKTRIHSTWLREGLTQSLILISVFGEKLNVDLPDQPVSWVDHIFYYLLGNTDPNLWKSLDHELPLIAEASPVAFITSVERLLPIDNSPILGLFEEDGSYINSQSYHTGLLWALENLAWMPEYLSRAAVILAELAEKDPGGNLANRPINSLTEIFKSWHPQTFASIEARAEALKIISQKDKKVAWALLMRLLPSSHGVAHPTHKMRWRLSDQPRRTSITFDEIGKAHRVALALLMEHFDGSEDQFAILIDVSDKLDYIERQKLLDFLEAKIPQVKLTSTRVWDELRKMLDEHRSHPDANWSLPEEILAHYEKLYQMLEPTDDIQKVWWLFTEQWPYFPEGRTRKVEYSERAKLLQERRTKELASIYDKHGIKKILELFEGLPEQQAHILGFTLATVITDVAEIEMLSEFLKKDDKHLVLIQTFIHGMMLSNSKKWVFDLYENLKAKGYDSTTLAKMFIKLPSDKELWDFIAQTNPELVDQYWQRVDLALFLMTVEDKQFGLRKLMDYGRFTSAIDQASHIQDDLDKEIIIELLFALIKNKPENTHHIDSYQIETLFEALEQKGDLNNPVMIQLEWLYMPILGYSYRNSKTPRLHNEMATNPDFFMEVISLVYKPDKEIAKDIELEAAIETATEAIEAENVEEEEVIAGAQAVEDSETTIRMHFAHQAYNLLHDWKNIPGVGEHFVIDEKALNDWINLVREKAKTSGFLHVVDNQIGSVLATYPEPNVNMEEGKPISWPPEQICEVLENIGTPEIMSGFNIACYNKRGSSTRGPFDGGQREHHLVKYFKALAAEKVAKYPKIGHVFESLARGYNREAKSEDERAERDRLDY